MELLSPGDEGTDIFHCIYGIFFTQTNDPPVLS